MMRAALTLRKRKCADVDQDPGAASPLQTVCV